MSDRWALAKEHFRPIIPHQRTGRVQRSRCGHKDQSFYSVTMSKSSQMSFKKKKERSLVWWHIHIILALSPPETRDHKFEANICHLKKKKRPIVHMCECAKTEGSLTHVIQEYSFPVPSFCQVPLSHHVFALCLSFPVFNKELTAITVLMITNWHLLMFKGITCTHSAFCNLSRSSVSVPTDPQ